MYLLESFFHRRTKPKSQSSEMVARNVRLHKKLKFTQNWISVNQSFTFLTFIHFLKNRLFPATFYFVYLYCTSLYYNWALIIWVNYKERYLRMMTAKLTIIIATFVHSRRKISSSKSFAAMMRQISSLFIDVQTICKRRSNVIIC